MTDVYTPVVSSTPWQSLAEPDRVDQDFTTMPQSRGLAYRELLLNGGVARDLNQFLGMDARRTFDRQRDRVFGTNSTLSAEDANDTFGIDGRLSFSRPISRAQAAYQHAEAQQEAFSDQVVANSGVSWWEAMGVSMAGAIFDPVSLPLWIAPELAVGRVVRGAAAAGRLGALSPVARGAVTGAAEGVAGSLLIEGANLWLAKESASDYDLGDAATNILLGGLLGSAAGSLGGLWEARNLRVRPPTVIEALPENSRMGAFADAMEAAADDVEFDGRAMLSREAQLGRMDIEEVAARRAAADADWADVVDAGSPSPTFKAIREVAADFDALPARLAQDPDQTVDAVMAAGLREWDYRNTPLGRAGADLPEGAPSRDLVAALNNWKPGRGGTAHPLRAEPQAARVSVVTEAPERQRIAKGEVPQPKGRPFADPEVAALAADTDDIMARAGITTPEGVSRSQRLADAVAAGSACLARAV